MEKCETANGNTAAAMRAKCPQCLFDLVACPKKLEAIWDDAMADRAIRLYAVHSETQRILIEAPAGIAQQICMSTAQQITQQGKQHGRCIAPSQVP